MNLVQVLAAKTATLSGCKAAGIPSIPAAIPKLTTLAVNLIKIAVPIALIIFGMWDLGKAVMQQDEKEINKGRQTFVKRVIAAVLVFFVITIVQIVINFVGETTGDSNIFNCVSSFISYKG